MGILDGLFGGGGSDPYDIYGDLFTDKQKAAMRDQQQGQGLLRMAAALGQAAMPSRMPVPIGAVLGSAAGALGTGQDAAMEQMLKAAQTAEAVRQSKQTRDFQLKFLPFYEQIIQKELLKGGAGTAPAAPGSGGPPAATGPGAAPAPAAPFQFAPVPDYSGSRGVGAPQPDGMPPGAMTSIGDPTQMAGLLAQPNPAQMAQLAAGGPDQVIRQGQGLIPRLAAGYGGDASGMLPFGQDDSGTPTVRLASAALAPFAIGNAVMGGPSSVEGVSDALSQRIVDMAAKMPPEIRDQFRIISGYRDAARQAQVNPGAPNSRHGAGTGPPGTGMAVDLRSDPAVLDWITRNPQYGVGFPLAADPAERNHLELLTAEGNRIGGSARRGGRFGGMGPDAGVGGGGQESSLPALAALSSLLGLSGGASGLPDLSALLRLTGSSAGSAGSAGYGSDVLDSVIAPLESSNRNVMQGVVDPSVSTAGGFYQITNSTWRDTAPKAGVDLGKYPTAISAPRDVQKQVAQQLLDTRGLQPWADFNPAVAAATGYRRGGRFAGMGPDGGGGGDLSSLVQLMSGPGGLSMPPSQMFGGGGPTPDDPGAGSSEPPAPAAPPINLQSGLPRPTPPAAAPFATAPAMPPAAAAAAPAQAPAPAGIPGLPTLPGMPPAPGMPPGVTPGAGLVPGLGVTPQALAALNAMAEMAKLGTPFKSLLETYYKSPEYLAQAASAAKQGEFPWAGPTAGAVAGAQAPYTAALAQYQAALDITKKQVEQMGDAATQIVDIKVPDEKGGLKTVQGTRAQAIAIANGLPVPALGVAGRLPGAGMPGVPVLSPEQTAEQTERGKAPYTTRDMTLTWPDGETRKVTVTGEQAKDVLDGKPVPAIGWPGTAGGAPATGAPGGGGRVGETVYPPGYAEATTNMLTVRRPRAEAAVQSLNFNDTAQRLLDAGIISGWGATLRLDAAKAKSLLGWSDQRIANTETFLATQARQVASQLASGAFGSGSSITDNDRQYAAKLAGGDSNLDEASLRFLLRQNKTAARWEIDRYNADVNRHDPRGQLPILRVPEPTRAEATQPSANQPTVVGRGQLGGKPYIKWSDGKWRAEGELPGEEKR